MKGKVFLVGAGPGDPELLTVKAVRLLQSADAVLFDDLVAPEILSLISPRAQRYEVGKRCGKKKILQQEINYLMVALAQSGLRVVRLKSGDPLIFGRAGEEMEVLRSAKIPYEVVPGITSVLGAAAAAQIPLTHRRMSSSVVFLTAHHAADTDASDWSKLAASGSTLVIYMPGSNYAEISAKLERAGLRSSTACAVISRATTPRQQVHACSIAELRHAPQLPAPTLLVIGDVVSFVKAAQSTFVLSPRVADKSARSVLLSELIANSPGDEEPIA